MTPSPPEVEARGQAGKPVSDQAKTRAGSQAPERMEAGRFVAAEVLRVLRAVGRRLGDRHRVGGVLDEFGPSFEDYRMVVVRQARRDRGLLLEVLHPARRR